MNFKNLPWEKILRAAGKVIEAIAETVKDNDDDKGKRGEKTTKRK